MGDQSFARLIKKRRDSLGFSQARLGELVGRSATTIRNWERGNSTPSERSDAVALAAVLGLDEREVLERAGFDVPAREDRPTIEQAYASLAPETQPEPGSQAHTEAVPDREPEPAADTPVSREPEMVDVDEEAGSLPADDEPVQEPSPDTLAEEPGPILNRAAPPTVLETTPPGEPSYLEDPDERQHYRVRAVATAAVVLVLVIIFLWSFDRATDALGAMWDDFFGMLDL